MKQLEPDNLELPPDCGGKARGLLELAKRGLRVPDFVFIPASVNDPLADPIIAGQIDGLGWPLVVRSSAAEEDGQQNAFAGMFESVHDVTSPKKLATAIKTCRQSATSERVRAYCQKRGIDPSLEVGVIVQIEAAPDLAGILFTHDPVFPDYGVAYVEWATGHGRHLVGGEALDGKAWLDAAGRILRADLLADTPPDFLAELIEGLTKIDTDNGRWDLEFFVKDSQLWWVQCRPATAQSESAEPAEPAVLPWELPGVPAPDRRKTARQAALFENWDEYNETTVTPLHYDGFYRNLWEACLDSVSPPDSLLPSASDFVRCKQTVPIAIDAAAAQNLRRPQYCEAATLIRLLEDAVPKVTQWQHELSRLRTAVGSHRILIAAFELYANLTSVRLKAMWSWIEGIDGCTETLGRLLQRSGLGGINGEALADELLAGIDHETRRMRAALERLASAPGDYGRLKEQFLADFGHFQVEGVPYALCSDKTLKSLAKTAHKMETAGTPDGLLAKVSAGLDSVQDKKILDKVTAELKKWFELRESSKTRQEIPYPLILKAQSQLARQLERAGAIAADSLELHNLAELATAVRTGKSPLTPEVVAGRRSILRWKQASPWIPSWYGGGLAVEQLSPGLASGPARVVLGLEGFSRVCPGDILVARSTNPAWTPLFAQIAGLIVEHGSRISHAAIVAREYGVPAVAGFAGATQQIADGELVEVDGNGGRVRRLDRAD